MNSCKFLTTIAVLLLSAPTARADRVCVDTDSGPVCQDKLTSGTIASIVLTVLVVLLLVGGAIAFFYRRRQFARAKAAVAANAYVIDVAQMKGAMPVTTYAAYNPHSAPIGIKPSSASAGKPSPQTAPTTYGVSYPYSSPKGTPPRSQSAISGTYTTMSGLGSGGKAAPSVV